jgi:hypothetical protein
MGRYGLCSAEVPPQANRLATPFCTPVDGGTRTSLDEDELVQARLGPNVCTRLLGCACRRLGHVPYRQVLDTHHRVVVADRGRGLAQKVSAPVVDTGVDTLDAGIRCVVRLKPDSVSVDFGQRVGAFRTPFRGFRTRKALAAAKELNLGHVGALGTTGYTLWRGLGFSAHGTQTNPGEQLGWWGAGVTSSLPLFTGGRIHGQVDQADASKDEARAATRALVNNIVLQVAQAYLSRLTAERQIAVA